MLYINEIFYSIQGESTKAGLPCVFIRLAGCNLKCNWCDTTYAISKNNSPQMTVSQILDNVLKFNCDFIEITGGEPLLQSDVIELSNKLLANNKTVAVETNGSMPINVLNADIIKILDIKCPDSGMSNSNYFENFDYLTANDEIKFVIASEIDFYWSCDIIEKYCLHKITKNILFSAVTNLISLQQLAELILKNNALNPNRIRMQLQFHKVIWGDNVCGV
jgi:7-carboxy-7-deazaguanine synthase